MDGIMYTTDEGAPILFEDALPSRRPTLAVLAYLSPKDFRPSHLEQLQRLEQYAWDGTTTVMMAKRIYDGEVWVFEVVSTNGIILLSLVERPRGLTLFVEGLAGDGIISLAEVICEDVKTIGREYGCQFIEAVTERNGFTIMPEKLGCEQVATIWAMEIEDERRSPEDNDADGHAEE